MARLTITITVVQQGGMVEMDNVEALEQDMNKYRKALNQFDYDKIVYEIKKDNERLL